MQWQEIPAPTPIPSMSATSDYRQRLSIGTSKTQLEEISLYVLVLPLYGTDINLELAFDRRLAQMLLV